MATQNIVSTDPVATLGTSFFEESGQMSLFPPPSPGNQAGPGEISQEQSVGRRGVYLTAFRLEQWGIRASLADEGLPYDLIASPGAGRLVKVQVKTRTDPIEGRWIYQLKRGNRHSPAGRRSYEVGDFDVVAFVALRLERVIFGATRKTSVVIPEDRFLTPGLDQASWTLSLRALDAKEAPSAFAA